jgi:hypothetical protein
VQQGLLSHAAPYANHRPPALPSLYEQAKIKYTLKGDHTTRVENSTCSLLDILEAHEIALLTFQVIGNGSKHTESLITTLFWAMIQLLRVLWRLKMLIKRLELFETSPTKGAIESPSDCIPGSFSGLKTVRLGPVE